MFISFSRVNIEDFSKCRLLQDCCKLWGKGLKNQLIHLHLRNHNSVDRKIIIYNSIVPSVLAYVSAIQPISLSPVPISGAGTSIPGPVM